MPPKEGLPGGVYLAEVLQPFLGSKDEQHISASTKWQQQAVQQSLRRHRGSKPASKSLKTTGEQTRITTNKFRDVSSRLARSMADLMCKKGVFGVLSGRSS